MDAPFLAHAVFGDFWRRPPTASIFPLPPLSCNQFPCYSLSIPLKDPQNSLSIPLISTLLVILSLALPQCAYISPEGHSFDPSTKGSV